MAIDTGLVTSDVSAGDDALATQYNNLRDDILFMRQDEQVAGATINGATLPVACYMDNTDDEWYACDANDQTKLEFQGFAITNGTDGNNFTIQFHGIVGGFTGLTKGAKYYVSDTGTMTTTIGTYEVYVGIALSATEILIDKGNNAGMQYVGSASGTGNLTAPAVARFAYIKVAVTGTNSESFIMMLFVAKVGATVVTGQTHSNNTGGGSSGTASVTYTWSGTTLTVSGDTPSSATAYFYR